MNQQKYILVYDDEESILEVIKIILEDNGYAVYISSKGEEVFEDIKKYNPSLLLLDIWMKGLNGHDIVKTLKADEKTNHIPVILISALNEAPLIAEKAGANGFLKKPFEMEDLLAIVKKETLS